MVSPVNTAAPMKQQEPAIPLRAVRGKVGAAVEDLGEALLEAGNRRPDPAPAAELLHEVAGGGEVIGVRGRGAAAGRVVVEHRIDDGTGPGFRTGHNIGRDARDLVKERRHIRFHFARP